MASTIPIITNLVVANQHVISNGLIERYSSSSNFWANISDVCASLVFVGVFAEIFELSPKVLKAGLELKFSLIIKRTKFIERLLDWFEKYKHRIEVFGFSFWMVIVLALAGEVLGARSARHFDSLIIGELTKQSRDAVKTAGEAIERAATNELQVELLKNDNLKLAQQIEFSKVENKPLTSVSAFAKLEVKPTEQVAIIDGPMFRLTNGQPIMPLTPTEKYEAFLNLGQSLKLVTNDWEIRVVSDSFITVRSASHSAIMTGRKLLELSLSFGETPSKIQVSPNKGSPLTPNNCDSISLELPFECEIKSGSIKLTVNGSVPKYFEIPAQHTVGRMATSVKTANGSFVPLLQAK